MNNNDYEKDLLNEFAKGEQAENETVFPKTEETEPITDLGRVEIKSNPNGIGKGVLDNDPAIQKMQQLTNYVPINMADLPTMGKYYDENVSIYIRAARVAEIREYSMMDETNAADILDKMNYILSSCTKVMFGSLNGSYKDILDHDRFYILLAIRELTFKTGETTLRIPIPVGSCPTPGCTSQSSMELSTDMLERPEPSELLEKYYDEANRCYNIRTKSYGTIKLTPPSIGVVAAVRTWADSRTQNNKKWDLPIVQMIPFLHKDWRDLRDRDIFNLATQLEGWDFDKYTLVYRFIELLNNSVGMSQYVHTTCETCGAELRVPVMFQSETDDGTGVRGGFKQLFVQTLSDRLDELL